MMKKIIVLICVATILFSCGGTKKSVATRSKKQVAQKEVVKTVEKKNNERKKVVTKTPLPKVSYQAKVQQYINEFAMIAKNEMKLYGIPASITLAQGILESGAGYGNLTQRSKNHFGIKCHDWEGDRVYHDDDRSQECFRKYKLADQSFRDHSLFLAKRKRYAGLFELKKSDYKGWAKGLKAAGYATDKKYPVKLISIIERYNLDRFDKEVLGGRYKKKEPEVVVVNSDNTDVKVKTEEGEHVVIKGDTLYSISKKYKITVEQLKAFNDLNNNNISIGQVLKVTSDDNEFDF
ncbi:glucosaminidase domain-containing protein [Aquimarina sp. MMG016]|uniref:glucosaminidase domain-containing protein n=1 Tax=Aquimarina sp. MMG016 TaxID=2822690 RepID=UPI001B3A5CC9|nr:glucosaminidase domain-containing protein [Aquimarina sp. MMG016]MBQ4822899.1 glucosaminidase domain-containing protein [Aquimarina sp. MMG016]